MISFGEINLHREPISVFALLSHKFSTRLMSLSILALSQSPAIYGPEQSLEKIKLAKMDAKFPDEVDTPNDVPARVRFQK